MIFYVHTNLGIFKINAKNPEQARKTVGKVKLAGNQKRDKKLGTP